MKSIVIEPHYIGSLEYFSALLSAKQVYLAVDDIYAKQTFRNRMYLRGSNRTLTLVVPVSYDSSTITKDVKIDHRQRWVKDHWGALYSSYGKAPFFEYFSAEFEAIWKKRHTFLLDLNLEMQLLILKLLQVNVKVDFHTPQLCYDSSQVADLRNVLNPKKSFSDRNLYLPKPYSQLFGDTFVPNLSIVDLLMCEGPQSTEYLSITSLGS